MLECSKIKFFRNLAVYPMKKHVAGTDIWTKLELLKSGPQTDHQCFIVPPAPCCDGPKFDGEICGAAGPLIESKQVLGSFSASSASFDSHTEETQESALSERRVIM
ncbi:hypothetical protein ROHU_001228 [Labeo rohita]|uniref:Uncharacterized protein n=1 Tax=Labeo rohita TaxID=84645 RepID=A0A498P3H9_LABRO|nr:hypothetical protein ROHU_001228 [Labeo rohita]